MFASPGGWFHLARGDLRFGPEQAERIARRQPGAIRCVLTLSDLRRYALACPFRLRLEEADSTNLAWPMPAPVGAKIMFSYPTRFDVMG
jgi:hypothetical protein